MGRGSGVSSRRSQGFTLIELLVVISIIGMLVGITTPAMSAARRISKRTVCGTNLHNIGQALQAYLGSHRDTYPVAAGWPPEDTERKPLYEVLRAELSGNREVFRCPADTNLGDDPKVTRPTYFETAGTSYEWETLYNGHRVGRDPYTRKARGFGLKNWASPMVFDFRSFHGGPSRSGSVMILYADFHVQADNFTDSTK